MLGIAINTSGTDLIPNKVYQLLPDEFMPELFVYVKVEEYDQTPTTFTIGRFRKITTKDYLKLLK